MLTASMPSSSARATAARSTCCRFSRGRGASLDTCTPYTYGRHRGVRRTPQAPREDHAMHSSGRRQWLLPAGLLLLSAVPVLAGAARVGEVAGGAEVTAENARFLASPAPVVVHIVGATVY